MVQRRFLVVFACSTFCSLFGPIRVDAQSYRDSLPVAHHQMIRGLVDYARNAEFEKLERTFNLVKPLTDALQSKTGDTLDQRVRSAIRSGDPQEILNAVRRYVGQDMFDLMDVAIEEGNADPGKGRTLYKQAYFLYLMLSQDVSQSDFQGDLKLKKAFREATLSFGKASPFGGGKSVSGEIDPALKHVEQQSSIIRNELLRILPELK